MPSPTPSDAAFGYLSIGYKTAFASEHLQQQQSSVSDEGEEDEVTDLALHFLQLVQSRQQTGETRRSCEQQQQQEKLPSYLAQSGLASCLIYVNPLKRSSEDGQRRMRITAVTSDSAPRHCAMTHNSEELLEIQQQQQQQVEHQDEQRDFSSEEEELPCETHSTDDDSSLVPDKAAAAAEASIVEDQSSSRVPSASDQQRRLPSVRFSQPPTVMFAIESRPPELNSALVSEAAPQQQQQQATASATRQEVTVTQHWETVTTASLHSVGLPALDASESSSTDGTFYVAARRLSTPTYSEASEEEPDQGQVKSLQEFFDDASVKASAELNPAKLTGSVKSILKQPTQSGPKTVDSGAPELSMVTAQNCQPVTSAGEEAAGMRPDDLADHQPPPQDGQRRASSVKFAERRHVKELSTSVLDQPVKRSAKRSAAKAASKKFAKLARRSAQPDSRQPGKTAVEAPKKQLLMEKAGMLRVRQTSKSLEEADIVLLARAARSNLGSKMDGAAAAAAGKTAAEEEAEDEAASVDKSAIAGVYPYDEDSEPYVSDVKSRASLTSYLMQLLRLGDFSNAKEFGTITKDAKSRLTFIVLISPEVREMFGFHAATVGKIARLTGCRVRLKRAILNRKTNGSGTWARFAQVEIEGVRPRSALVCDRLLRERFRCYEDRRPLRQQDGKASIMPLGASWDAPNVNALAFACQQTGPKTAASPGPDQEASAAWDAASVAASPDDQYRLISTDYGPVKGEMDAGACDS